MIIITEILCCPGKIIALDNMRKGMVGPMPMAEFLFKAVCQCHTPLVVLLDNQGEGGRSVGHNEFVFFSLVNTIFGAALFNKLREKLQLR